MTKEIIVNAGELESRVAIVESGRLMELHVEREPKIVGNIYKGRVTKVLKGMDAAFVEIGIERNAFLAASDVVSADDDDSNPHGRGRDNTPSISHLLKGNQELLVQVVRAPLGTKGARITTRLSLPGRYMVLMMNSGTRVGVSRKIEDPQERQRLRAIANDLRHDPYSLIVRTEAEGKTDEELRQDMTFLIDMAKRIERKADSTPCPSLVHGDLTLIFRLIRDAFTRDVNRLVVDSPATYENVLELVGMLAPRMKNRVFLFDEAMPIFHAYNIEPEIERTLRRKIWLPSGGYLVVDQAEALTAIDVNTGRFVGSTELAETVLTTNLQAADEVARQLRLRDLGGIIVVDFIDMDNPKHRQQVTKVFEEALKRDRAKLKVHNISPLGLVEMTRKRTGESLVSLLTEPCPFCSGIGRVQNALTMALRIEREIAATAVEYPQTEAFLLHAHPRVIGNMLGFEGEAHRDLQLYLEKPVYLRMEEHYHPNAYHLERLTLEQALVAVPHLEDDEVVEGVVMNPNPEVSLSPLVQSKGCYLVVPELDAPVGARVKVRIREAGTSLSFAVPLSEELRAIRTDTPALPLHGPVFIPEFVLPSYLRDEQQIAPPRGLQLLSPTAESVPEPIIEECALVGTEDDVMVTDAARRRRKCRRRKQVGEHIVPADPVLDAPDAMEIPCPDNETSLPVEIESGETEESAEPQASEAVSTTRRRRRRRRGRGGATTQTTDSSETAVAASFEESTAVEDDVDDTTVSMTEAVPVEDVVEELPVSTQARKRRNRRRRDAQSRTNDTTGTLAEAPVHEPNFQPMAPDVAEEALLELLNSIPDEPMTAPPAETDPFAPAVEESLMFTEIVDALPAPLPLDATEAELASLEDDETTTDAEQPSLPLMTAEPYSATALSEAPVTLELSADVSELEPDTQAKPRRRRRAPRPKQAQTALAEESVESAEPPLPTTTPPVEENQPLISEPVVDDTASTGRRRRTTAPSSAPRRRSPRAKKTTDEELPNTSSEPIAE